MKYQIQTGQLLLPRQAQDIKKDKLVGGLLNLSDAYKYVSTSITSVLNPQQNSTDSKG